MEVRRPDGHVSYSANNLDNTLLTITNLFALISFIYSMPYCVICFYEYSIKPNKSGLISLKKAFSYEENTSTAAPPSDQNL